MQSAPETTDEGSSVLAIQNEKSDYAIIRPAMENLMKLYGLRLRHKKDYQLVKRIINDMRKYDKKWPVVDENSKPVDDSDHSDGEEEEQDTRDSQIVDPSPTSLSAIAPGSSVALLTKAEITTAPATMISMTAYRWFKNEQGDFVDYTAAGDQSSVEAVATTQGGSSAGRKISDNAEIIIKDSGKGGVKKEMGGGSGIAIDRRGLTPAGLEAMSLTDGRDIRGSESYVAGEDKGAGTLEEEKNSGNNQSNEMWW
ncbi:hypothetical protein EYC80_000812 [Monilinia laxa]|uniref:Uncharacterized protein n=1 Tax=Monilinia laxa TaxID=61186 RepID=A0A5N6K7D0_MONLA|nr:hypothetical protein EYC80_000812 [Monilinia laxa]